jgi:asparagine synthase (glutamine-hydrolysing)
MTEALFAEQLEETAWHNEFANPDLNSVGKFALSKLTRDMGVKVVLTGEGSDEHFGGYSELLTDYVRERDPSYAQAAPSEGQRVKTFQELEGSVHSGPEEAASAEFARKQINNVSFVGFTQTAALGDALFQTWTTRCYGTIDKRLVAVHNTLDGRTRDLISRQWHPLHSALYIWTKTSLANALLTALGDRVEMAHSIEGRQPFLDHKVTEYAMALPPSLKIKYDAETGLYKEKWILVEAMKPFVTAELYKRKKHAFGAPVKWEVGGALYKLFATVMTRENVEGLGFLEWEKCEGLMAGAFARHDRAMWRQLITIVQLIMLGKRFGVKRAEMEVVL